MTIYTIYKISIAGECYVGSTIDFQKRMLNHKNSCYNENDKLHYKVYKFIRENGGWESCVFSTIGTYECETKTDAHFIEEMWRVECEATLNSKKAYQSKEDRAQDLRNNTIRRNAKQAAAPRIDCPCGGHYRQFNANRHFQTQRHIAYLETL